MKRLWKKLKICYSFLRSSKHYVVIFYKDNSTWRYTNGLHVVDGELVQKDIGNLISEANEVEDHVEAAKNIINGVE